jgi:hypothetical protein
MLKRALIIAAVFVVAIVIFFNWFKKDTKKHSPAATATYTDADLNIKIDYCRPYAKGRIIFGDEAAEALQPYGEYWRLGANEATTFESNTALMFNDKKLEAGKYSLYAYPGHGVWTICVNSDWDRWGAQEADKTKDVLRTEVPAINDASFQEQFEIKLSKVDSNNSIIMNLHWDKTSVDVPLKKFSGE